MERTRFAVRLPTLLLTYAVFPLSLILIVADHAFGQGYLKSILPRAPDQLFLYSLIFVFPHIVASFFSFANKEYLAFYKRRFVLEVPLLIAVWLLFLLYNENWAFIAYIVYTEYHQAGQHGGIGRFYFKTKLPEFTAWKWSVVALTTLAYGLAYPGVLFPQSLIAAYALPATIVVALPFLGLSASMFWRMRNMRGRLYLSVLGESVFSSFVIIFAGYPLLAILASRIAHDVPAFLAYITHERNRQVDHAKNVLYDLFALFQISPYILVPVLAIVAAYGLVRVPYIVVPLLFAVAIIHYYIEGFMWKSGSPHRTYLAFRD